MKRIILTGGGTAGHVTPNIALIPKLRELGFDIHYIGSYNGIEKDLIEPFGIPYHGISSGKLRRYFSLQNFTDRRHGQTPQPSSVYKTGDSVPTRPVYENSLT